MKTDMELLPVILSDSPFIGKSWSLMDGRPHIGLTTGVDNMFLNTYKGRFSTRNYLRDMTLKGFLAYKDILNEENYTELQKKIDLLSFFPPADGLKLVNKFKMISTLKKGCALWKANEINTQLGIMADNIMKNIFTKSITIVPTPYIKLTRAICQLLNAKPLHADVKVCSHATAFIPKGQPHICDMCNKNPTCVTSVTAVDLLAGGYRPGELNLIELKTFKGDIINGITLKRFMVQAWLTWILFVMTYRRHIKHPERVNAYLVVVLPALSQAHFYNVMPLSVTKKIVSSFPFLKFICQEKLLALTPHATVKPTIKFPFAVHDLRTEHTTYLSKQNQAPPLRHASKRSSNVSVCESIAQKKIKTH